MGISRKMNKVTIGDIARFVKRQEANAFFVPKEFHDFIINQKSLYYRGFHFYAKTIDGKLIIECQKDVVR